MMKIIIKKEEINLMKNNYYLMKTLNRNNKFLKNGENTTKKKIYRIKDM
jgi:hypothetical protein